MPLRRRQPATQPGGFREDRAKIVAICIAIGFVVVIGRSFMLHLFPAAEDSLHNIADHQYAKEVELAPYRGNIYDRRGEPLAISVRKPSLAVNPRVFQPSPSDVEKIGRILGLKSTEIRKIASRKTYFAWLKRHATENEAEQVLRLEQKGLFVLREHGRFYPAGEAAAQLLGFVGIDNRGLGGLELLHDKDLRGQKLLIRPSLDAHGNPIFSDGGSAQPEKMGHSLHLTIDRVIQEIAEEELERGVKESRATKGFAIVADPHTGKILAVANYPQFDPNTSRSMKLARNHALLDVFEPGSVTKPFIIGHLIDKKKVQVTDMFDCENGSMAIGRRRIRDTHKAEILTVDQVIVQSSNICTFKIARKAGEEASHAALTAFGFGLGQSKLRFPGAERGWLSNYSTWKPMRFANIAFGQGFTTTATELVQAMAAIANGGLLHKPTVVERMISSEGLIVSSPEPASATRVIAPETAKKLRDILELVVTHKEGSGSKAKTESYSTAGKTGTAQKANTDSRGYSDTKFLTSFLGFAPVTDPYLVAYVVIDEPKEKPWFGGAWAAPAFSRIVDRTLKYLNVAPDILPKPDSRTTEAEKNNARRRKG